MGEISRALNNAPEGTALTIEWIYLETEPHTLIDTFVLESQETTTQFQGNLSIPDNGWPVGSYEVRIYIDDEQEPSEVVPFYVE